VERGARVVQKPWEESDADGTVRFATIQTYGDTTHTFVDKSNYTGHFLPGYKPVHEKDPVVKQL
jgi:4-hydroxyphenylpyruvate dioxygenase